jgi:hypothetical protein
LIINSGIWKNRQNRSKIRFDFGKQRPILLAVAVSRNDKVVPMRLKDRTSCQSIFSRCTNHPACTQSKTTENRYPSMLLLLFDASLPVLSYRVNYRFMAYKEKTAIATAHASSSKQALQSLQPQQNNIIPAFQILHLQFLVFLIPRRHTLN